MSQLAGARLGKASEAGIVGNFPAHLMIRELKMSAAYRVRTGVVRSALGTTVLLCALALLSATAAFPQSKPEAKAKPQKPSGTTKLRVEVTGGEKNQPVESASVYVKFVQERALAKDKKFEMNLKTNRDGVVKVPEVPRGKIVIQVIAESWKPFGRWYDIEEEEQTVKIHLEKPPHWY